MMKIRIAVSKNLPGETEFTVEAFTKLRDDRQPR
jgi:hypothetical protein